jgi:hypothetical protein
MKIKDLQTETQTTSPQISATLMWEDRDRPEQKIYIGTTSEFAQDLSCNPHSFLLASSMIAFHLGEKRLAIDSEICPELLEGLKLAMDWMKQWYHETRAPLQIESKISPSIFPRPRDRSAIFFSGGVDATASLRLNHLKFPSDHPRYIKDALIVHGISNTTRENFEKAVKSLSVVANEANINLIPIYTNIYSHIQDLEYDDYRFWRYYFCGSALAAIAHAFHGRINTISLSSSFDIRYLEPWGSHPLLDSNYSSYDLKIRHEDINYSRLDKIRIISDWEIGLTNLRVCDQLILPDGYLNCGRCHKCLPTMTALLALGILDKSKVFPPHMLSPKVIRKNAYPNGEDEEAYYLDLLPLLQEISRSDIIDSINRISKRSREQNWQGWIKRFDRAFLNNFLANAYKKFREI